MKQRTLPLLMAVVMLCTLIPMAAPASAETNPFAEHDAAYEQVVKAAASGYDPERSAHSITAPDVPEDTARTIVIFPEDMALTAIADALTGFEYSIIGRSEWRQFVVFADIEAVIESPIGSMAEAIEEDLPVEPAEEDIPIYAQRTPNDPGVSDQWALPALNMFNAWNITTGSKNVTVAVIDSGCYRSHPDLTDTNILSGYDYVRDRSGVSTDGSDHGTGSISIIAAHTNNSKGMAGANWSATILPLRTLDDDGRGYTSDSAAAIRLAADSGADVINLSLSSASGDSASSSAVEYATKKGCIIVASAGNNGSSDYRYPASFDHVISVAAMDVDLEYSYFTQHNDMVDVTGPGSNIYLCSAYGGYGYNSGTSFSAPYISGIAALARSIDDTIDHDDFMNLIKKHSRDLGSKGRDDYYGYGLPDAAALLKAVKDSLGVPVTGVTLNRASLNMAPGESVTLTATVSPSNASNKSVTWKVGNTDIATVSSSGKVTAKAPGRTRVYVTTADGGFTADCPIVVEEDTIPVTGITLNKSSIKLKPGGSSTLTATVLPTDATNQSVTWKVGNTGVATVSSKGKVTAKAVGKTNVYVTTADGGYTASCSVVVEADTVPVTGVKLNKSAATLDIGDTITLTATVSPSNATDKSVTWKVGNSAVATVNSNGRVTAKGPGKTNVYVTTNDGDFTAYCSITVNGATVPVTGVSLNRTSMTMEPGEAYTLTATIHPSDATDRTLTWKTGNTSVATVSSNGRVTARAAGRTNVYVTTADGGYTASCSITVQESVIPVTGVTLSSTGLSLNVGDTAKLTATVKPSNATDKSVTWKVGNTSVASVTADGKVTAKGVGRTNVYVTTNDGAYTAYCPLTVIHVAVPVTGVRLTYADSRIAVGSTMKLTASVLPSTATNRNVIWSSSNTSIATVDDGTVRAWRTGKVTISATTEEGGYTASCVLNAYASTVKVTSVMLNRSSLTVSEGLSEALIPTVFPTGATNKDVTWSSSNSSVAAVTENGVVTGRKAGTATITAKTVDGGYTARCTVKVDTSADVVRVTDLTLDRSTVYVAEGGSAALKATVLPANASNRQIVWTSSHESIAKVNTRGEVTGVSPGYAIIQAEALDGGFTATCQVHVGEAVDKDGWLKEDGKWYYYEDGIRATGLRVLVGYQRGGKQGLNTYNLDETTGQLLTGFKKMGDKWYYFNESGSGPKTSAHGQMIKNYYVKAPAAGYVSDSERAAGRTYNYYFDADGAMYTGWVNNSLTLGRWMYFGESGSSPKTSRLGRQARYGIQTCVGNNGKKGQYMFSATGVMRTGTIRVGGEDVVFSPYGKDPATDMLGRKLS